MTDNDPQTQLVKYLTDVHSIEEQARIQMERAPKLVEGPLAEEVAAPKAVADKWQVAVAVRM
jgi:hypothetical protein